MGKREIKQLEETYGSIIEASEALNIPKMTIYRWKKKGTISKYYKNLLSRLNYEKEIANNSIKKHLLSPEEAFEKLEECRVNKKSWKVVAQGLGIPERTIMRWRKTKKINKPYLRKLYYYFRDVRY